MRKLLLAVGFVLALATPAQAHHPIVSGSGICNQQTGLFDVTWNVANSENVASPGDRDMTITVSNRASVPTGTVIQEASSQTFSEPSLPAGTQTLTVTGRWEYDINGDAAGGNTIVVQSGSTTINLEGECVEPEPIPSPSPSPSAPAPSVSPTPEFSPSPNSPASPEPVQAPVPGTPEAETPAAPEASPSPESPEEAVVGEVVTRTGVTRSEDVSGENLPAELAFTGFSQILGLLILAVSLIGLGFYARGKGYRRAR